MKDGEFFVKYGNNAPNGFVKDVFQLDEYIYSKELCGEIKQLEKRTKFCKDSFILLYDKDILIGYLNFFPISNQLFLEMNDPNNHIMRDDDIEPDEMEIWRKNEKHDIFIISVVLLPQYRKSNAIVVLSNSFLEYLRQKNDNGYYISSISGTAISNEGAKFLQRFRAKYNRTLEHGYEFYITEEKELQEFLQSNLPLVKKDAN